jgi:hypothetical protein
MNARCAAQRIHLQPGIIGQHEHPVPRIPRLPAPRVTPRALRLTQPLRQCHRLLGRITGKRPGILNHLRWAREIIQSELAKTIPENRADFPNLVDVACSYYKSEHVPLT